MSTARTTPPNRNRRLLWVAILGVMLSGGLFLIFQALSENTQFFENPSDVVAEGFEPRSEVFKIGGLVADTQGVVVSGRMVSKTQFLATELLAKHDENYRPEINYRDEQSQN